MVCLWYVSQRYIPPKRERRLWIIHDVLRARPAAFVAASGSGTASDAVLSSPVFFARALTRPGTETPPRFCSTLRAPARPPANHAPHHAGLLHGRKAQVYPCEAGNVLVCSLARTPKQGAAGLHARTPLAHYTDLGVDAAAHASDARRRGKRVSGRPQQQLQQKGGPKRSRRKGPAPWRPERDRVDLRGPRGTHGEA